MPAYRRATKRARKPGHLADLQRVLWHAIIEAKWVLDQAEEPELRLRAIHALSQASGQYAKLLEIGELEARIAILEAKEAQYASH